MKIFELVYDEKTGVWKEIMLDLDKAEVVKAHASEIRKSGV